MSEDEVKDESDQEEKKNGGNTFVTDAVVELDVPVEEPVEKPVEKPVEDA